MQCEIILTTTFTLPNLYMKSIHNFPRRPAGMCSKTLLSTQSPASPNGPLSLYVVLLVSMCGNIKQWNLVYAFRMLKLMTLQRNVNNYKGVPTIWCDKTEGQRKLIWEKLMKTLSGNKINKTFRYKIPKKLYSCSENHNIFYTTKYLAGYSGKFLSMPHD